MTDAETPAEGPADLARTLLARTRWTSEELSAYQHAQLGRLLAHAATRSPYYRRTLGADATAVARGDAALRELPTLTKATLMGHFDEIVTDGRLRRDAMESHLAGPAVGRPLAGHRVFATAGSTGTRGVFAYSSAEFAVWNAALLRMLAVMGVTPNMRVASIGAPSPAHLSRQMFDALAAGRGSGAPDLSVTTPTPALVTALNDYQPDAVPTYASTAAVLAEEQLAGRLHIQPSIVGTGADVLTEDMAARIREAWGVEPHQAYLATEAPLLASTCTEQVGMHLWEDLVLVEVVDANDRPAPAGVPGHKVLITNLVNMVQPLIRYELSDSVTLATGPSPAGLPFRRLRAVEGRNDDIIQLPSPDGGTVAVHPVRLRAPFIGLRDVVQYQLTYDGALTAHVVLRPGSPNDTTHRIRAALTRALHDAGARPPSITVESVERLERETGHAAKFKLIRTT